MPQAILNNQFTGPRHRRVTILYTVLCQTAAPTLYSWHSQTLNYPDTLTAVRSKRSLQVPL